MSTEFMVNAQNVTKKYDDFKALDDLSLEVNRGGAWALLGPNGAGKTTFLKCLLGLKEFDGLIQIDGIDIQRDPKKAKSLIGYVPQHPALYDDLSVQEELRYFGDMRDVKRSRVRELIEFVGLEAWARQPVGALSGGMKQRLMLAVALLSDPPVLLLDEPTANLDVRRQLEFRNLIKLLVDEGKTVVLTTHLLGDVDHVAEQIMLLNKGKLVTKSTVKDLFKQLDLSSQMYIELVDSSKEQDAIVALEKSGANDISVEGSWLEMGIDPSRKLDVLNNLRASDCEIRDFKIEEPNLEDAFMKITGEN
jgi:ABC-type multidrug transport system ATPase subunit|tara:strand:- start:786 stop:1703 length:918 start_codon:yes stop_codon:yes gene_type:complete